MTKDKQFIRAERRRIMQQLAALEIRRDRGAEVPEADFEALGRELSNLIAGRPEVPEEPTEPRTKRKYHSVAGSVTKDIIAIAEKNGITKRAVYNRVYEMKMDPMEAATVKNVKRKSGRVAIKSGITVEKFLYRKQLSVTDEMIAREFGISNRTLNAFKRKYAIRQSDIDAMRQPLEIKPGFPQIFDSNGRRIIPPEVFELADRHNVNRRTVYSRICLANWNYYKAATHPVKVKDLSNTGGRKKAN